MPYKDYTNVLYEYTKGLETKTAERVFNVLDKDVLTVRVNEHNEFLIEPTNSWVYVPNFANKWIAKEMVKRGFVNPFYDKKGNFIPASKGNCR